MVEDEEESKKENEIDYLQLIDFLSDDGKKGIAMIEAYLDESGTHRGAPLVVVAGFIGDRKVWKSFVREWRVHLKNVGISYFHAKDPKCESLKAPLAKAILRRDLFGVVCSVSPKDFKANASDQFTSRLGNPYTTCAFMCAEQISKVTKEKGFGSVSVVYEVGQPKADFIYKAISAIITEIPDYGIARITFAKKEDVVPLQTADFLSHVVGTNETKWNNLFLESEKVEYAKMTSQQIAKSSKEVGRLLAQQSKLRRKARRDRGSL